MQMSRCLAVRWKDVAVVYVLALLGTRVRMFEVYLAVLRLGSGRPR